jgi:hypothetical protein
VPLHAALCLRPAGRQVAREVEAAILDAGRRLADAGWTVSCPHYKGKSPSSPAEAAYRACYENNVGSLADKAPSRTNAVIIIDNEHNGSI